MRRAMLLVLMLVAMLGPGSWAAAAPTSTLEIQKVDQAGQALPGACFQIYDNAGGGERGAYRNARCDLDDGADDGTISLRNLEPGEYVLEENRPPEGYVQAPDLPVTVTAEPVTVIVIPNHPAAAPSATETPSPGPTPSPADASPVGPSDAFQGPVDIGDRSLFLSCSGTGSPTVLLEAGGPGRFSESWTGIQPEIAASTRVCSYDRASMGQSDPAPDGERTAQHSVNDLRALLSAGVIECPCVFVGESWGGVIIRLFASQYPTDIAGLIFVDAVPPGFIKRFDELAPAEAPDRERLLGADNDERVNQLAGFQQADLALAPPVVPAIVITHGLLLGFPSAFPVEQLETAWRDAQVLHARALKARLIVAATSGSDIVHEQPEVVIDAVEQVVAAVRDPATAFGALQIHNVEATGKPLPGACFQIYDDAGNGARGAFRGGACDLEDGAEDGTTTLGQLTAGDYVVEERKPPGGYLAAADSPVSVAGLATDHTITNDPIATPVPSTPIPPPPIPTVAVAPTTAVTPTTVVPEEAVIIDLGTLGGSSSDAYTINAAGQVVGVAATTDGERHAFLWEDGAMTDLGTLGGPGSAAYDINDAGQIVGVAQRTDGQWRGFLWEDGAMTEIGTFGGDESRAFAINADGQVVGVSRNAAGDRRAFLWENGEMTDLGSLGGPTSAGSAINAAGHVAGSADTTDGRRHVFLWQNGEMTDLGTLGGDQASVTDLSDGGQVVGRSTIANGEQRAFLWLGGRMTDLGALDGQSSEAWSINAAGQIGGEFGPEDGESRAFLWERGTMIDLNELLPDGSEWVLTKARGMGDDGRIVGLGVIDGESRGFLLTLPVPVPAPDDAG